MSDNLGYVRPDCRSYESCDCCKFDLGQLSPVAFPGRLDHVDPVRGDFRQPLVSAVAHRRNVLIMAGVPAIDVARPHIELNRIGAAELGGFEAAKEPLDLAACRHH